MTYPRITHKGHCDHAQSPYARRVCRKAAIAAAAAPTYAAGDRIVIADYDIILTHMPSFSGRRPARWSWVFDLAEIPSVGRKCDTAAEAIADATAKITGPRCRCGEIATMNASTGPACDNCYDRYAA